MQNNRLKIAFYVDYCDSEYVNKLYAGASRFYKEKNIDLIRFPAGEVKDNSKSSNYQHLSIAAHIKPNNIDGILFASGTQLYFADKDYLESYMSSFKPLPLVNIGFNSAKFPSIISDCTVGMKEIVENLIKKHNCKKIALMAANDISIESRQRQEVFCKVLQRNGIHFYKSLVLYGGFTYAGSVQALEKYYAKTGCIDFDSIVSLNDYMAYGCIDFFTKHRLSVPEDILVTGYDNISSDKYTSPTLTSVKQNIEEQGYIAAESLYKILNNKKPSRVIKVNTKAIFRQSTGDIDNDEESIEEEQIESSEINLSVHKKTPVAEWFEKSSQFISVVHLYSELQLDVPLNELKQKLNKTFRSFGITAAAVCLFKNPVSTDRFEYFTLPSEAILLSVFDDSIKYEMDAKNKIISFDPRKKMIPSGYLENLNGIVVNSIYRKSIQYGYILFRPGSYDMTIYTLAIKILSSALASSYSVTCAIEEKKKLEEEFSLVNKISITDEMTGLLNRRGVLSLGQKTLEVAEAISQSGIVIYGDIDGLKKINDTYGHANGDVAIVAESKILKKCFAKFEIIGRLGGDEYVIIAPGLSEKKFLTLRKQVSEQCEEWNKKSKQKFKLSISLGYTVFTSVIKKYNIYQLLELADESLYQEKLLKKKGRQSKKFIR